MDRVNLPGSQHSVGRECILISVAFVHFIVGLFE